MADPCHKQGCKSLGTKFCGACGAVSYCSVEGQKGDWKVHKISCMDVNKLPATFLSAAHVNKFVNKTYIQADKLKGEGKIKETILLLQKLLAFVEKQFGTFVEGTSGWRRANGEMVDNVMLINIRTLITECDCDLDDSETELKYATEALQMAELRDKSDGKTMQILRRTEKNLAAALMDTKSFEKAEYHSAQSLMFARLIKAEDQVSYKYKALMNFAHLRGLQSEHVEAINLCEKAYILASDAHGPVHVDVQEAVSQLIDQLAASGDFSRADDYCRINYENLTDPRYGIDQHGHQIAQGMMQLAEIWLHKAPVDDEKAALALAEEAEKVIRKSCNIVERMYSRVSTRLGNYLGNLGDVSMEGSKYTAETRGVLERSLALKRKNNVFLPDEIRSLNRLVHFYDHIIAAMPESDARIREVMLREIYAEEVLSLRRKHLSLSSSPSFIIG